MKLRLLPLLIAVCATLACKHSVSKFRLQHNKEIDQKLSADIAEINARAYGYLQNNDYSSLSDLFSDTLSHSLDNEFSRTFVPQMQKSLQGRKFRVFDEYYIENPVLDSPITINGGEGEGAYKFKFQSPNKQTYVSMLLSEDATNEIMVTLVYGNYDGKWKLNIIRGEDYSIDKKNAIAFYKQAISYRDSGDYVDAINTMWFATHCANPAGSYMSFNMNEEINKFSDSLSKEIKDIYPLPYTVKQLKNTPQVFNIHYEMLDSTLTPMIMYLTTTGVRDTVKLKSENDDFHRNLGSIFKGMDKYNKKIIYRVYNQEPVPNTNPPYYGFVEKN
jgi:hypothetical protein